MKHLFVLLFGFALGTSGLSEEPKTKPSPRSKAGGSILLKATEAFEAGRYPEAEQLLNSAQKENLKSPGAFNLRGAIFTKEKAYDQADEQYKAALALDPKYYPAMLNRAEMNLLRGRYAEAQERYQELEMIDPASELIQFKLVLCSALAGQRDRAEVLVVGMKFPGKTPAYYYARAALALKAGQKQLAQTYFANVKKYYSADQCAYFDRSLKDLDLTLTSVPAPLAMPAATIQPASTPSRGAP